MDLVAACKEKLASFRIKELKDVLTQLGISKQGKKQDLIARILATLSDEQVSKMLSKKGVAGKESVGKLVDEIYRKMQVIGATDLASKSQGASDSSNVKVKDEMDTFQSETKVCCPCGNSSETESMIKCEDTRCRKWQHIRCVLIPEKPMEGAAPIPDVFYCEICRLTRADPFLVSVAHPLQPVKLITTNIPTDGTNPIQCVEKTFQLTKADKDLLSKQDYDIQAWCMLLNDKVPFRMQWPQYADLQINGVPVRAINRPGSQLLGANGRDDGPVITPCTKDGINKISLSGCDARIFCLGIRIVKRRTVQQILNLIPKENDGELFEDALARVVRCIGGGAAENDADSDSDLEVVADSFSVNLRCPMSGSRIKVAGRFKPCAHMGCFDLEVFVELNQRSRKWQCPICLKNYSLQYVIIDPFFNRITSKMKHCGEDVTEIEVKPDGSWRSKARNESERRELGELWQWHAPDGTLCVVQGSELKIKVESSKQVKQGVSESHIGLKLGIRKNQNGVWEVSKPEDLNPSSSGNTLHEDFVNREPKVIPMSSSATGSEDPSINQDGWENLDFTNNGIEHDSLPLNLGSAYGVSNTNPSGAGDAEIIVLSDSDDENDNLVSNQTNAGAGKSPVHPPRITNPYSEDLEIGAVANSFTGLYSSNNDEFGMPLWSLSSGNQAGTGLQLFSSDVDRLVDLQPEATSMNGYTVGPDTLSSLAPSTGPTDDTDINDGLVDNPLALGGEDPSLKIFLPTRALDSSIRADTRRKGDESNGMRSDDWISLRLGDGNSARHNKLPAANGVNPRQSRHVPMDSLAETASLLLGMNEDRNERASRQRSDSPFSFPRQKRSVRQRLYLSIDSDSE